MSRFTAPVLGVALVAGAFWVATKSYEKHFAAPALSETQQSQLGVQLLEFPRQLPPIERLESGQWHAIRLQPSLCDAVCQGQMVQETTFGIHVIPPSEAVHADLEQVTSAENYAVHQGKVLLINPQGRFAGSLDGAYSQVRLQTVLSALNQ